MSLKCSVFGHRFGQADVTRERQEQGSEVVITITETETCERCGETRILSENKEVTTLETPSDIVGEDLDEGAGTDADGDPEPAAGAPEHDSSADTDEPSDRASAAEATDPVPDGPTDPAAGPPGEPDTAGTPADDAELIDEAERTPARTPGSGSEGPTEDSDRPTAGDVAPDHSEDDGVILEEGESDDGRAPGEWPQEPDGTAGDDWAPGTDTGELRPVEEEQPDHQPTSEAVPLTGGEFRCPECGFGAPVESSSLREGDFCPECHRGSLERTAGQ